MRSSILLPLHAAAGARLAPRPEAPALQGVLTFGDVPGEYGAGREGALLFDATDRGAVRVAGADAAAFLHRLLSNDVRGLAADAGNANLLLSPKGKVLHGFDLSRGAETILLSTAPGGAAGLAAGLDTYLFSEDVRLEDVSEAHAPLELCGPAAEEVLSRVLGELPELEDHASAARAFAGFQVQVVRLPVAGSMGFRADGGPEAAPLLWKAMLEAGARGGGFVARDSLRVEAGAALLGVDVDENVYPQEARLERAFSLTKGCYVGQEVVAKIDTYGGLNKRLVALAVEHDDPVARGTRVFEGNAGEERDLGLVTSWAYSFVRDGGLALGFVKRRHQAPGTRFRLGADAGHATIVALPVRPDALPPSGEFE